MILSFAWSRFVEECEADVDEESVEVPAPLVPAPLLPRAPGRWWASNGRCETEDMKESQLSSSVCIYEEINISVCEG